MAIEKLRIDSMYAFVSENDEGEGIMATTIPLNGKMVMMPLVGGDMARVTSLIPIAQKISEASGKSFRIIRFERKEDITDEYI